MRHLIICIDFDGTIVKDNYPAIGTLLPRAKEAIQRIHEDGHTIIISTCRCGPYEEEAKAFLDREGIPYDFFNANDPDRIRVMGGKDPRKISADLYIDDHNYLGSPVDWPSIYRYIILYGNDEFIPAVQVRL